MYDEASDRIEPTSMSIACLDVSPGIFAICSISLVWFISGIILQNCSSFSLQRQTNSARLKAVGLSLVIYMILMMYVISSELALGNVSFNEIIEDLLYF